jgi:hypothetical protein
VAFFADARLSLHPQSGGPEASSRPAALHRLETIDFYVSLQSAVAARSDVRFIPHDEIIAAFPEQQRNARNPLALRVRLTHDGVTHDVGVVPDLVFGLRFPDGSRRCFVVEIGRGTMPISRADITQTSFERKMRAYLTAHAAKQHERQLGWKTFRVLTVTTDHNRMRSMMDALRQLRVAHSPGTSLFFFATRGELSESDPLAHPWRDGAGRETRLV